MPPLGAPGVEMLPWNALGPRSSRRVTDAQEAFEEVSMIDWDENVKGLCVQLARVSLELHDVRSHLSEPAAMRRVQELQTILEKLQAAIPKAYRSEL